MDRTFTSNKLTKEDKTRRATICTEAINPADIYGAFRWILDKILKIDQYNGLKTADFARVVKAWGDKANNRGAIAAQTVVSVILVRAQGQDQGQDTISWLELASNQLNVPETVLKNYTPNDVSLANLIHITRGLFDLLDEKHRMGIPLGFGSGPTALEAVSKFDPRDTSPKLQHKFCDLWNKIVDKRGQLYAQEILKHIRHVYLALHKGTDSAPRRFNEFTYSDWILDQPSSYPRCKTYEHHPAATESVTEVLRLDNYTSDPINVHPTTIEYRRLPSTSRGPATANVTKRTIDTSPRTMPRSTREASTSSPPLASTSSPQRNAGLRASSDEPDHPSPPIPASETILRTNPPSSSTSSPEFHPSMVAIAPSGTPRPTSFPDLGAAAERGGG
jgi:hypothetical protein